MATEKIMPVKQFRKGNTKCSIFERLQKGPNGEFTSQSVNLQVSYTKGLKKDGSPNWINHNLTIVKKNIEPAIEVLTQARDHMVSGGR